MHCNDTNERIYILVGGTWAAALAAICLSFLKYQIPSGVVWCGISGSGQSLLSHHFRPTSPFAPSATNSTRPQLDFDLSLHHLCLGLCHCRTPDPSIDHVLRPTCLRAP